MPILKFSDLSIFSSFCCLDFTERLIFSEVTKYTVNDDNYITSMGTNEISNFILETRKMIYKIKNGNFDIKKLFIELKKEVDYKKFNFLTS